MSLTILGLYECESELMDLREREREREREGWERERESWLGRSSGRSSRAMGQESIGGPVRCLVRGVRSEL